VLYPTLQTIQSVCLVNKGVVVVETLITQCYQHPLVMVGVTVFLA